MFGYCASYCELHFLTSAAVHVTLSRCFVLYQLQTKENHWKWFFNIRDNWDQNERTCGWKVHDACSDQCHGTCLDKHQSSCTKYSSNSIGLDRFHDIQQMSSGNLLKVFPYHLRDKNLS